MSILIFLKFFGRKKSDFLKFYFFYFFSKKIPAGFFFTHTLYFTILFLTNDNFLIQWLKVVKYATMGCLFRVLSLSLCIERMNSINFKRNYL